MIDHPCIAVLFLSPPGDSFLAPLTSYLQTLSHIRITLREESPDDLSPYDVVVTSGRLSSENEKRRLEQFVQSGGGWLALLNTSETALPECFGVRPGKVGPKAELRVFFTPKDCSLGERLPETVYLNGFHHPLEITNEATQVLLAADWHYRHSPVLVSRTFGAGRLACTSLQDLQHPILQQILYRVIISLSARQTPRVHLGVGILGYSPAMGRFHGLGAKATAGLNLKAVADLNEESRHQAELDFPQVHIYPDAEALAADPECELVIIATPPNSHARLSMQMMAAGKHVVCEKPLALTYRDATAMMEEADKRRLHLSCHQNRRFDVDYLAIKQALEEGLLGHLFYLETFVGGFSHPCGFWHSHEPVCGGTAFDWGGHYLDWILSLFPDRVREVIGTRHKRVWPDVTNADQERVQIRFQGGQEAEFMHSDIAAFRKPKWYLLGTQGAIVGDWREEFVFQIDPVHYYQQQEIPCTEMTPHLRLFRRHPSGEIVLQHLALPKREPYPFHRNLADHLLTGEPLTAPLIESVRVVAVLEAAARSAARGGAIEVLDV